MTRACVFHPELRRRARKTASFAAGEKPDAATRTAEGRLAEAAGLAVAIGLDVAIGEVVRIDQPRPGTLFGKGKLEQLNDAIQGVDAEVVIVDGPLTPIQQRNLERAWQCKVIDRAALILEIFADRARTREGRLQVELALLSYQRSRLVRSWTHLERQRGGFGFMGGPGETQIEADRRQIRDRISRLKKELAAVSRTRGLHRSARQRVPYPVVALVGYTNAGKSTLFNRLTGATVRAEDRLFATLDPTMRAITLPSGRRAILSDTVGFVSDLPHDLITAFHATLEEVVEADLIVHVRDIAHAETNEQRADVLGVLQELGIAERIESDVLEVLNKIDLLPHDESTRLMAAADAADSEWLPVSAVTGEGVDRLTEVIDARLARSAQAVSLTVTLSEGATIAMVYDRGEVLSREDDEEIAHFQVLMHAPDIARIGKRPGVHVSHDVETGAERRSALRTL